MVSEKQLSDKRDEMALNKMLSDKKKFFGRNNIRHKALNEAALDDTASNKNTKDHQTKDNE